MTYFNFSVAVAILSAAGILGVYNEKEQDNRSIGDTGTGIIRNRYCRWNQFYEDFIKTKRRIPQNVLLGQRTKCNFSAKNSCQRNKTLVYWRYDNTGKPSINYSYAYKIGMVWWLPSKNCFYFYLEVRKGKEVLFHKYYDANDTNIRTNQGDIREQWNFTNSDYGQIMTVSLYGFPGGKLIHSVIESTPKDSCEKATLYAVTEYYWSLMFKSGSDCGYYRQGTVNQFAATFCTELKHPSDKFIADNVSKFTKIVDCDFIFNHSAKNIWLKTMIAVTKNSTTSVWSNTLLGVTIIAAFSFIMFLVIVLRLPCQRWRHHKTRSNLVLESDEEITIATDSDISVMILHRPGCDILDSIVRDLLFVIKSHDIEVQSPLLEMSNIDAEGGVATFMQRNIHQYTYIIILVTDTVKDTTHVKHKPFEFTLKMLSGLSFQQNQCSRYIPVYLKDFKNVLSHIPLFLVAGKNQGYKIPQEIKDLVRFMKKTKEASFPKERTSRLDFFVEKMKTQSHKYCTEKHSNCCEERCFQGLIKEDVSDLWSEYSSVVTRQLYQEKLIEVDSIGSLDLSSFDKVNNWKKHMTIDLSRNTVYT